MESSCQPSTCHPRTILIKRSSRYYTHTQEWKLSPWWTTRWYTSKSLLLPASLTLIILFEDFIIRNPSLFARFHFQRTFHNFTYSGKLFHPSGSRFATGYFPSSVASIIQQGIKTYNVPHYLFKSVCPISLVGSINTFVFLLPFDMIPKYY